jgi:hypothetical protein
MNSSEFDLDAIHQLSFGNEQRLVAAKQAGCFDCLAIFPAHDIKSWVNDKPIRTASRWDWLGSTMGCSLPSVMPYCRSVAGGF